MTSRVPVVVLGLGLGVGFGLGLVSGCSFDDDADAERAGGGRPFAPVFAPPEPRSSFQINEVRLIPARQTWWAWPHGGDLGEAWRQQAWEPGPMWLSGNAPLGYGEGYVNPLPWGGDLRTKPITVYFRRDFFVADPDQVISLRLDAMVDDGFVYYVNGLEVGRANMPAVSTSETLALGHEANERYETLDASHARWALQQGWNTLAVEVHQGGPYSSDLVFDVALSARLQVSPPPDPDDGAIARGAEWFYWDRGAAEPDPAWRTGDAASGWHHGPAPLGYGETYVETTLSSGSDPFDRHVTTYVRRQFLLQDPAAVGAIVGELLHDDGVVIYLNGTEIDRAGMPEGPVTGETLALPHEADGYVARIWSQHRDLLVPGVNTIAAEIHQADRSSSDLVFDLSLRAR